MASLSMQRRSGSLASSRSTCGSATLRPRGVQHVSNRRRLAIVAVKDVKSEAEFEQEVLQVQSLFSHSFL